MWVTFTKEIFNGNLHFLCSVMRAGLQINGAALTLRSEKVPPSNKRLALICAVIENVALMRNLFKIEL